MEAIYNRYREEELTEAGLTTQQNGDVVYLVADGDDATASNHSTLLGLFSDGDVRISYECYDTAVTPEVTMIGYQSGNTLTLASYDEISFSDVMAGRLTKEELIEAATEETTGGNPIVILLAAALCVLGIYWFAGYYVKKKKADHEY